MWDWFVTFLTNVLAAIQGVVGDWGIAVIILTVILGNSLGAVLLPLLSGRGGKEKA